jgi:STE24 endopeptidase
MERVVVSLFLALFILEFLVEFALNEMNMSHVRKRQAEEKIPDFFLGKINSEDYRKSVQYTLAKGRFQRWAGVYGGIVTLFVLFGGVLPYLDRLSRDAGSQFFSPWTQAAGILFCLGTGLIFSILSLPTDLYSTFVLEERFGFNKTTLRLYLADKIKGFFLGVVIGVPFLFGVLWLMDTGPSWWLWAFLFIFAFQLLMVIVYPTLIAPLFNKFEPLKDGVLRERILALADQVGFKTGGIYTMDGSRRSAHSNAYFTGIGKTKRIVLFDTLIEQMTLDQGLAVLAHEMGHYKMKHIRRMLFLKGVFLLVGLYILSLLVDYEPMFRAFGLESPSHSGALVLFSLLSGPFTFYLHPLMNLLSRRHEYEADRFAVRTLKDSRPMEEALINLTVKNLSNLTPHPWYSAYHYSHPSSVERISAVRQASVSVRPSYF